MKKHLPLYLQISERIIKYIKNGNYIAGSKLPSERELANKFSVSRNTVKLAIEELVVKGLVQIHPRSGTFVSLDYWNKVAPRKSPDWPAFFKRGHHYLSEKNKTQPTELLNISGRFPGEEMSFIKYFLQNIPLKSMDKTKLYSPEAKNIYGSPSLRAALADYLSHYGINAGIENILITSSTTQVMHLITSAFLAKSVNFYHEKVSYFSLRDIAANSGANVIKLPLDDEGIVIDKIKDQALYNRNSILHVQTSNHHPTGITMSIKRRQEIIKSFAERSIPIIELDSMLDIYSEAPPPLKSMDKNNAVIFVSNLARATAEDISMSWVVADEYVIQKLAEIKAQQDKHVNTAVQLIAETALTSGLYSEYMKMYRDFLLERRDAYNDIMDRHIGDIAQWDHLRSSHYFWVKMANDINILQLKKRLKLTTFNPGSFYDPDDTRHLSVCTLAMPPQDFERAIIEIKHAATKKYRQ